MDCINLKGLFGSKYRIAYDQAYDPKGIHNKDPWMMQIPCAGKGVTIYPFSHRLLALELDYHNILARKVAAIPGVELIQDGEQEKTYLFPLALFDKVAEIVKPRQRRQYTPEQRLKAAERLAKVRV